MTARLLQSTIAAVALAVVLLGLPLALAVRTLYTQRALDELQREAELTAVVLNQPMVGVLERAALLDGIATEAGVAMFLLDASGPLAVVSRGGVPVDVPSGLVGDFAAALEGRVGRAAADGALAVSIPVRLGGGRQVLRAVEPADDLRADVRGALLAVAGLAVSALTIAAALALWQARRLGQPLEALAAAARRLGDGDFSARAPRSGIPEPDDVAVALEETADRLAVVLERSRSFSADASHQLRTPLTALRLDLEALEAAGDEPGAPELVQAALVEADRLETTIAELLALAAAPAGSGHVDLGDLAADRLDAWRALAQAAGRRVELTVQPTPRVRARGAAVGQALQVLLDNALQHGAGTITVSVGTVAGGVRLCVADEGAGMPGGLPDNGGGRGLALARSLVEAEGGRLRLEAPATVCIVLPAPELVPPPPS